MSIRLCIAHQHRQMFEIHEIAKNKTIFAVSESVCNICEQTHAATRLADSFAFGLAADAAGGLCMMCVLTTKHSEHIFPCGWTH